MRTVKLVIIGASGVGKTSIRNQYISGQFTTGYRATIGADFITKTLPHHSLSEETVTLQIWDTAGQERFSSLSAAFFRGADAVILMFDVNQSQTLHVLAKWWSEFKASAPVPDDEADKFCCVVVGNKMDIAHASGGPKISELRALEFIDEIVPPVTAPPSPMPEYSLPPSESHDMGDRIPSIHEQDVPRTDSIDIAINSHRRRKLSSRSGSRSTLLVGGTIGTMTTTHTVYHTPSSSIFDAFESARASPAPTSAYSLSPSRSPSHSPVRGPRRMESISSISSVPTITPSLFVRGQKTTVPPTACTTPSPTQSLPQPPERRPKLFFTSAKTGDGVSEVFEYIARRVVMQWDYEEAVDARTFHMQDTSVDDTIRLGRVQSDRGRWKSSSCCSS